MTPRVAIACSGLGHVHRGNETWAATVGEGLHKSGGNVIVFGSGARPEARSPYVRVACLRRDGWIRKLFSWDKAYLWEQVTFARSLKKHLRADRFDIVHTADPNVAQQLIAYCKRHKLALIYQDSLFIGSKWCAKFEHVQALAPFYKDAAQNEGVGTNGWRVIPQTVDTRAFAPSAQKAALRKRLFGGAIPENAFVALAVGDFSAQGQKRHDWIISEAAKARGELHLVFVGNGTEDEIAKLRALAGGQLKSRTHFFRGIPHRDMPSVYAASDLFVHAAVREPFGLVFIEAMASGSAVIGHDFEVTRWIVGDGGEIVDMTKSGALASAVESLVANTARRSELSAAAVARARKMFDRDVVLPMYHAWYQELAARQQR